MSLLSIERKEIAPMPFLFVRRQTARSELSQTLAQCFCVVFPHCMKAGLAMAGFPLARYPAVGPGLITVEAGIPLVEPTTPVGDMHYGELPGGPAVFAVHSGPYDHWVTRMPQSNAGFRTRTCGSQALLGSGM